jgi:hypothetical protein
VVRRFTEDRENFRRWNCDSDQNIATVYGPWAHRSHRHCPQHGVAGHHRHELLSVHTNTATELGIPDAGRPEPCPNFRSSAGKFH